MKAFTFIEVLIVLVLYSLLLLLVFPLIRDRISGEEDLLDRILAEKRLEAFKKKTDIVISGNNGIIKISTGETFKIPNIRQAFCLIKSSGFPYYCMFKSEKYTYILTNLGKRKIISHEE